MTTVQQIRPPVRRDRTPTPDAPVDEELVTAFTHELRNSLNTVSAGARMLLELELPEGRRTDQLRLMVQAADRMDRLVGDYLDLSLLRAGAFTLRPQPVRPVDLATSALASCAGALRAAGVQGETTVPEDLPRVRVDTAAMLRVFGYLLRLAARDASAGGSVTLRADRRNGVVRFELDVHRTGGDGPDMKPAPAGMDLPPGGRLRLALAVTRALCDAHGGSLRVPPETGEDGYSLDLPIVVQPGEGMPSEAAR